MSLTAQAPQPTLAWQFQSSNVDSVRGLAPSSSLQPGSGYLQGTAALVTTAPTSNTAVSFDGTTGCYMTLGVNTPTNFNTNSSNLFVEAWVYVPSLTPPPRIYGRASLVTSAAEAVNFNLQFDATGVLGLTNGTTAPVTAPGTMTAGTWNHAAFSITTTGLVTVFLNGQAGTPTTITIGYNSTYSTFIGAMFSSYMNGYVRDLRVVQGGVVPVATFTPGTAPFSYDSPGYVANMGTTVFTLLSQFFPLYVTGKYGQAIKFNNILSPSGQTANSYATYDVSSLNLVANSSTMSLWLNSDLSYPTTAGTAPFYVNLQGSSYNGLLTLSATSTISFRKGTAPITTVGSVAAQTGVWQHHCVVFSNVGASASNTITSYYFNGSLVGFANNARQSFTSLNLGCQITGTNGALCSIDDVRLFNTALNATQVQAIYAAQGMPSLGSLGNIAGTLKTTMTGAPLLSQLSAPAVGAFSLRAVNGTTAKAVQVKRQSDNATQDFWADRLGNLLTAPVTGQTLASWLGGSTGNVVTWYDQSGQGRNATGTQATIRPTSNVNQQWAVNPTNGGLSVTGGAFLNGTDFTIVCTTKRLGTQGNDGVYGYGANSSWVSQASVPTTYGNNTRFALVMPNAGSTDVRFNDSSFSAAFSSNANVLPSSFVAATEPVVYTAVTLTGSQQRMYINGTANGLPISTLTQVTANASTGFTIGTVNYYGNFLGEIGELIIFNSALSASDISTLCL